MVLVETVMQALKDLVSRTIPGPSFMQLNIDYALLQNKYNWNDWELNTTRRMFDESKFLWKSAVRIYNSLSSA